MTLDVDLEKCKKYLRSILLSTKGSMRGEQLAQRYLEICGEAVPHRHHRFSSLESFLVSLPDVCRVTRRGGDLVVEGVATPETRHIKEMVHKQGRGGGGARARSGRGTAPRPGSSAGLVNVDKYYPALKSETRPANSNRTDVKIPISRPSISAQKPPQAMFKSSIRTRSFNPAMLNGTQTVLNKQASKPSASLRAHQVLNQLSDLSLQSTQVSVDPNIVIPSGEYPSSRDVGWDVTVTGVQSTSILWVICGEGERRLATLQQLLASRHRPGTRYSGGALPPGHYFSGQLGSGQIVRARVVKVDRLQLSCLCFLVDYGRWETIAWEQLVPLAQDFLYLAAMAVKVVMAGVRDTSDPQQCSAVSQRLLGRKLLGVKTGVNSSNIPVLTLFDGDQIVSQQLEKQLAKLGCKVAEMVQVSVNNNQSPIMCANGGTGTVKGLALPPLPGIGDWFDLRISHVVSPAEVYIQSYLAQPRYSAMTKEMTSFYSGAGGEDADKLGDIAIGMFVAVRQGDVWRRAKVIMEVVPLPGVSKSNSREFLVMVVDTGEQIIVNLEDIWELALQFGQLPIQVDVVNILLLLKNVFKAIRMKMTGLDRFEDAASVWMRHICHGFQGVGLVDAKVEETLVMTVYDTSNEDFDTNLNSEIVKLGLAQQF